jgi:hypothetical protein
MSEAIHATLALKLTRKLVPEASSWLLWTLMNTKQEGESNVYSERSLSWYTAVDMKSPSGEGRRSEQMICNLTWREKGTKTYIAY